jgi:hypothetical protein
VKLAEPEKEQEGLAGSMASGRQSDIGADTSRSEARQVVDRRLDAGAMIEPTSLRRVWFFKKVLR